MHPSIPLSAVLCRSCLHRRAWRLQYHVSQVIANTSRVHFHSKASPDAGKLLGETSAYGTSLSTSKGWSNQCFMITSSRPSIASYQDILFQLSKLRSTSIVDDCQERNTSILILATPTFTTWLENKIFMGDVLETAFPTRLGSAPGSGSDITALVAVVDGLPPKRPMEVEQTTEGFAFLVCDHQITLPEFGLYNANNIAASQSSHQRSSILFRMGSDSSIEGGLDIEVPLANTIFRNGRTSTLFASRWKRTGGTGRFKILQQVEMKSAKVYPASSNSIVPISFEIPLVPLTPLRRVVSGLGNILRQVTNAQGDFVSASQELEASVDSYLETRSLNKQTVAVWALIIPNSVVEQRTSASNPAADSKQIRALWTDTLSFSLRSYVGEWLQQGRGVTLHRVVSGGGGWGLKKGLLSLDPETTLRDSPNTSGNFDSSSSMDSDQIQALGNVAKPGSWVQFLIAHKPTPGRPIDTVDIGTVDPGFQSARGLTFGCIASTVDDMPQLSSAPSVSSSDRDLHPFVDGYNGHFGAMSAGGIFIGVPGNENSTAASYKIDVPNSEFNLGVVS